MSINKYTISSIVNIDSSFRNKIPKNIFKSDNKYLPLNPLILTKASTKVKINKPNHNLSVGDNIIIQNVEGYQKILANTCYLINNFNYMVVIIETNISSDYKKYTDELYINIELVGSQTETNSINNIQFNNLLGYKKSLISNDILNSKLSIFNQVDSQIFNQFNNLLGNKKSLISNDILNSKLSIFNQADSQIFNQLNTEIFNINNTSILDKICLFIELPENYINLDSEINYRLINQTFKITYQHIGGIKLGYLNVNYPINNINYQNSHSVYSIIDENTFEINLNYKSFGDISGGGKNVQVMKITNTITGYPDADSYVIDLKKSFNNVSGIELISSEFPYVDLVVQKNVNDKLYWRNIEDGQTIYKVQLDDGFYSTETLIKNLKEKINLVPRTGNNISDLFNLFDIEIESNIQKITFKPYNILKLPNKLSIKLQFIDNIKYYVLNVEHPNNLVNVKDIITIINSEDITVSYINDDDKNIYLISKEYINKTHTIYSKNLENQNYDIILGNEFEIKTVISTSKLELYGGENISIKSNTKISLLFDKPDTIGEIMGFINVGEKYSVTDYSSQVSNKDSYIYNIGLNTVGNPYSYSSGFINLSGKYNYMLMYLNDIEYVFSNNNLASSFAKICFSGNPGDVLFNTYVPYPVNVYSRNFPISTLNQLTIKFTYPDGTRVNFRNIDHSFTLRITEEILQNSNTYLNSQAITVSEEFQSAQLKE